MFFNIVVECHWSKANASSAASVNVVAYCRKTFVSARFFLVDFFLSSLFFVFIGFRLAAAAAAAAGWLFIRVHAKGVGVWHIEMVCLVAERALGPRDGSTRRRVHPSSRMSF